MPMRHRVELPSETAEGIVQYEWSCSQRWNGLSVRTFGPAQALAADSEEEFIAEHYWAYTRQTDGSTIEYQVEHPSWRILACIRRDV